MNETTVDDRSRLGGRLVEEGHITREELREALERQEEDDRLLGEILVEMGAATSEQVDDALEELFGIESVSPSGLVPDPEALDLVRRELAEQLQVLPLEADRTTLVVATSDPLNLDARDRLQESTNRIVDMRSAPADAVRRAIDRYFQDVDVVAELESQVSDLVDRSLERVRRRGEETAEVSESAPVVELIDTLLELALVQRASDLHVEPRREVLRTRLRIDGVLQDGPRLPRGLRSVVTTRLKILGGMDISENRLPQDGRARAEIRDTEVDMRLSSYPTVHGESLVVRLLQKEQLVRGLEELGMTGEQLEVYRRLVHNPNGILLVTGPTGSGKTTTLYSTLTRLNSDERNVMTLEDPVEYELEDIRQSQINRRAGLDFATGLRSLLRQDPDVVLVGEVRDEETMDVAVRSALTGHLVFSTLHTNDAAGAVPRLLDMGAEPYLVSSSLLGVVAQRLVRLICPQCPESVEPSAAQRGEMERLGYRITPERAEGMRRGEGCSHCGGTGYRGRVGLFEVLEAGPEVQEAVVESGDASAVREAARSEGMTTMLEAGLERVFAGETTLEEVLRVAA